MLNREEYKSHLNGLAQEFIAGLPGQIGAIETAWARIWREGWISPALEDLRSQVHSLIGAAASLGFVKIDQSAVELQTLLRAIDPHAQATPPDSRLTQVDEAIQTLRRALFTDQQSDVDELEERLTLAKAGSSSLEAERSQRLIYMVEDDPMQAAQLSAQVGYFGYIVRIFHNLNDLEGAVRETAPTAILMDVSFPEGRMAGYDAITRLREKFAAPPPVIFISINDEMPFRLQAVRVGGEAYFSKPVDVGSLIEVLDRLHFHEIESPYRVLIVDDSRVEANYNAAQLKKVGAQVEIVHDPLRVIDAMIGFNPDLVLLDMYMPDCTGMELAQVIRQMEQFISVPIVFLSAETDKGKQFAAMGIGGDDFLTKPIQPDHLISAILSRIERYRKLRKLMIHDGLTGLLNHITIKERLVQELERAKRHHAPLSFIMLDLDLFKQVNDTYGHAIGDRVLKSLAHLLTQRLRASDSIGRYGGEEFAIILANTDETAAARLMSELCKGFAQVKHQTADGEFSVTFSGGVASYPSNQSAEALIVAADRAMYAAKEAGRNQIMVDSECDGLDMSSRQLHSHAAMLPMSLSDAILYKQLVDNANNIILRFDLNGKITFANPFAQRFFGFSEAQMLGQAAFGMIFPQTAAEDISLRAVIDGIEKQPEQFARQETRHAQPSGQTVWVAWSKSALFNANGELMEILCIGTDITERKQVEKKLEHTVTQLSALNRISQAVTNQLDFQACVMEVSNQVAELFNAQHVGVSLLNEERTIIEFVGNSEDGWNEKPDQGNQICLADEPAADLVIKTGKAVFVENALNNPRTFASQPLLKKFGIHGRVIVPLVARGVVIGTMNIDFTDPERQFTEAELELSEIIAGAIAGVIETSNLFATEQRQRRYSEALVQNIPTAVIMVDLEMRIRSWNPAAEKLFGYQAHEVLGRNIDDVVSNEENREEAVNYSHNAMREGDLIHAVTRRNRKDGSLADVELLAVPITIEGKLMGSLAIYHDITELQRARLEAEAANEAKSAFLATMSHEIRTPLNAVIGMTTLLLDTSLTSEQQEFSETIRFSSESLLTIINDILDFSKIEAGHMEMELEPFDLRECVESALDLVTAKATDKGIDLAYILDNDVPAVIVGDATRLRQILLNLLSNAVKFTQEGEVVLTVSAEKLPPAEEKSYRITFTVRDTGLGIPPERMNRLFRSFSQVDASTTRKYGGTGLGLAISKRLTELMGGNMWVESAGVPGEGSSFHFTILANPSDRPMPVFMHRKQPELGGKRVLIVDDNATNRYILMRQVTSWGMLPEETAFPHQALEWIRQGKTYDLALLDMQMPDMDGQTLANEIREVITDPACLPLVMLTSLGLKENNTTGVKFAAYLTKPIKPALLYTTLLHVLGSQPALVAAPPLQTQSEFSHTPDSHTLRILLAEDIVINQKVALQLLGRLGYRADLASNGFEVLDALRRQPYDVVLMDVQMPDMDGLEAARRVRSGEWIAPSQNGTFQRQPYIIAMTANAMQGDREVCMAAGMDDYVSKPIRVEDLKNALNRARQASARQTPLPVDSPAKTVPVDSQALDEDIFNAFQETMGGSGQLTALLSDYLQEANFMMTSLQAAVETADLEKTRRLAHSLKSSSMLFGAMRLAELCKTIELEAGQKRLDFARQHMPELDAEFSAAQQALRGKINPPEVWTDAG